MKLNLWANLNGETGYSIHARKLSEALIKEGVDLAIEGSPLPPHPTSVYSDALIAAHSKDNSTGKTVSITLPQHIPLKSGQRLPGFYPFCVFEGDKIPGFWAEYLNQPYVTKVLVPSEHTKKACVASGVTKEIAVVPHGVDPVIFNMNASVEPAKKYGYEKNGQFTFLYVGGWADGENDRKGLDIALRAFCAEFKAGEKVRFIVKINTAYQPNQRLLFKQIEDLKLPSKTERAEVQVLAANMPEKDLAAFYRLSDCFVMPSKAEAFCMPIAEAMACGLPVIATGYGGQTDYLSNAVPGQTGSTLDYELEPATGGVLYEGVKWAKPNQKTLQFQMRWYFEHQKEGKEIGELGSTQILENYTWKSSAKKLIKAVEGETYGK